MYRNMISDEKEKEIEFRKYSSYFSLVCFHFLVQLAALWNGIYRQQTVFKVENKIQKLVFSIWREDLWEQENNS